jgi:large subunit ribosomal protein L13
MKTIDATNKKIGRVAQEAAMALMGKDTPMYEPNKVISEGVHIINASKSDISEKKKGEKEYKWFTGYPSGLKTRTMDQMIAKRGVQEIYRKAVLGMLPKNRLRAQMIKKLKISE